MKKAVAILIPYMEEEREREIQKRLSEGSDFSNLLFT
jgi:cobalamin-dependent methionine synthase I